MDRTNEELNEVIEEFISTWHGTAIGAGVKNMYENGDSYAHICEAMNVDPAEYGEE